MVSKILGMTPNKYCLTKIFFPLNVTETCKYDEMYSNHYVKLYEEIKIVWTNVIQLYEHFRSRKFSPDDEKNSKRDLKDLIFSCRRIKRVTFEGIQFSFQKVAMADISKK